MLAAQYTCTSDPNCQAVVGVTCDDSYNFKLCSQSSLFYDSRNACVYTKGKRVVKWNYIYISIIFVFISFLLILGIFIILMRNKLNIPIFLKKK